jgi:plasmid stabilization system protein ParE
MTVIIAPEAADDLVAAADYLHARNRVAADKLVDRVMRAIRRLDEGAFDGPETSLKTGERVRSWPRASREQPRRWFDRGEQWMLDWRRGGVPTCGFGSDLDARRRSRREPGAE